jgi:hypothetical protein
VRITGCKNNSTNHNDKADNDLPPIKEVLGQISYQGILTEEDQNAKAVLQDLDKPALDTSRSCISPKQSRVDNGVDDSQSTQGMYSGSLSL